MATVTLLTVEDLLTLPNDGRNRELVRGRLVEMNPPYSRHGQICSAINILLGIYARDNRLGHVLCNDAGVITERNPDTVRGADVAFYSYSHVPPGPLPKGYLQVPPDLVFEVRSPTDRWSEIHVKVGEYLAAGVKVVCVADQQTETVQVFRDDEPSRTLTRGEDFTLPDVLGDFRVPVRRFFE
jgi:Uma2 family endonuclease